MCTVLSRPLCHVPRAAQEVDRLLGDICSHVHDALPPKLARAVCSALVSAVQSVLLDGGPFRWGCGRGLGAAGKGWRPGVWE